MSGGSDVIWSIETPTAGAGALAVVRVWSADARRVDDWLDANGLGPAPTGSIALRSLLGVDEGVVARWGATSVHLTPHGGAAVMRALARALQQAGASRESSEPDPRAIYPEAGSLIEARALAALATAASPRAVDLLLDQSRRWAADGAESDPEQDRVLDRLLVPPTVAAVGPANVGKSTLLNALARRTVASVADEPGTTRDHVGALVDLDGLRVRWIDTPGVRASDEVAERRAAELAERVVASADVVLACGDAGSPAPDVGGLRVALRTDLGLPAWVWDVGVSATTGEGLAGLARSVRRALVSDEALASSSPWRFWGRSGRRA